MRGLLLLGSLFLSFSFRPAPGPKPAVLGIVATRSGRVAGGTNRAGTVAYYKGIPFAAPPVGPRRWRAPQPVAPWPGVRQCRAYGPSPMQPAPAPFSMWTSEFLIPAAPISEDCLYLNVWTSAASARARQPVLVWIYGGGFNSGGSGVPIYDGEALAQQGIVVVSFNYRVGPFGFLAHPALTQESGHQASGNYGLLDQVAALRWVQQNIAAFGGDPRRVTIAGQSAGGVSVSYLVVSPLAKGLFQQAIAESGAGFGRPLPPLSQAEQEGVRYSQALGASSLAALRQLPAAALLQPPGQRGPVLDGYVLPLPPLAALTSGQATPVKLLLGWNEQEGLLREPLRPAAEFQQHLQQRYGSRADSLRQFYPARTDAEATRSQYRLARDLSFGLPAYTWATAQSQLLRQPTYMYRFARQVPATGEYVRYGAFHTGEVPYVFGTLGAVDRHWQPGDYDLAHTMRTYWVNFVRTGNPNGPGLPAWPAYHSARPQVLWLDLQPTARALPDQPELNFLRRLPAN